MALSNWRCSCAGLVLAARAGDASSNAAAAANTLLRIGSLQRPGGPGDGGAGITPVGVSAPWSRAAAAVPPGPAASGRGVDTIFTTPSGGTSALIQESTVLSGSTSR